MPHRAFARHSRVLILLEAGLLASLNTVGCDLAGGGENGIAISGQGDPVVPETAVCFGTNTEIIGGSAQTNLQRRGSVTLSSARPLPEGEVGTVQAKMVGTEDVNTIVDPNSSPDGDLEVVVASSDSSKSAVGSSPNALTTTKDASVYRASPEKVIACPKT